jgi:hypothetical protein
VVGDITLICGLRGFIVTFNNELINKLEDEGQTNSVMMAKGVLHLLIGPASKVNHDCYPNAQFTRKHTPGKTPTLEVTARRQILVGEGITVSYKEGHCVHECMCTSCEDAGRNGWSRTCKPRVYQPVRDWKTRQLVKQIKRKDISQITYSYSPLGIGSPKRLRGDYHSLTERQHRQRCGVCSVHYSYRDRRALCAACFLRTASGVSMKQNIKRG